MTSHPTCKTCKHFEQPDSDGWDNHPVYSVTGLCKKVPHNADMCEWNDDEENVLKEEYSGFKAVVSDASGYHAALCPTEDFYCAMHSDLEPVDN